MRQITLENETIDALQSHVVARHPAPIGLLDEFLKQTGDDPQAWKRLAIAHLRHVCAWNLEQIGFAFGHPKGHISRLLRQADAEIKSFYPDADKCSSADCSLD